jgi:hypothetical protein
MSRLIDIQGHSNRQLHSAFGDFADTAHAHQADYYRLDATLPGGCPVNTRFLLQFIIASLLIVVLALAASADWIVPF